MSEDRPPDAFTSPPRSFVDAEGREIEIRCHGDGPLADADAEREALVAMYADFDPADRAQGIPPSREEALREWTTALLRDEAVNVLAWHGETVAGHATLVPDDEGAYELAIFVHQTYQRAGIGGRLIRCLLGEGRDRGIERVWLTVERWNKPAISLYREVGFETTNAESFELEMALSLH